MGSYTKKSQYLLSLSLFTDNRPQQTKQQTLGSRKVKQSNETRRAKEILKTHLNQSRGTSISLTIPPCIGAVVVCALDLKELRHGDFEVFQDRSDKLKKLAQCFQDAIHFHPGSLQPKILMFGI